MKIINFRQLPYKTRRKLHRSLRAAVQLLFFVFFPSVYTAAFGGIKYIFTQLGISEAISLTPFVAILCTLCAYTIVFGRFFCGFACAFGSFGDALHGIFLGICKKAGKKLPGSLKEWPNKFFWVKYVILTGIVLLCFAGAYTKWQEASPWEVFSMLRACNLSLSGHLPGLTVLLLMMAGMCVWERFFCQVFCPMGAVFSLLPVVPFFSLQKRREQCPSSCSACSRRCPCGLDLPGERSTETPGGCFQCQECVSVCPRGNIHCGIRKIKGNEVWFVLMRAGLLLTLFLWLGV